MKIGYFGEKFHGGGLIFGGLYRGFLELGIQLIPYQPGGHYDFTLLFHSAPHIPIMNFDGIENITGKFAFVDCSEYGWWTHNDYWRDKCYSAFAPKSIEYKPKEQQRILNFLRGKSYPFFIREYYKKVQYHQNYHPIDYPLYYASAPQKIPTTFEEYANRAYDLYIFWGHSHPSRTKITEELNKLPFKISAGCDSDAKINQLQYFDNISNAKMSLTYDGYGSGGFRETEVLSRTLLLKNNNGANVQRDPLTNGVNFIEYQVKEDFDSAGYPTFNSTSIGDIISERLQNLEQSYEIYKNGYNHCMTYFTERATAQYILNTIKKHDWNIITPEEVTIL